MAFDWAAIIQAFGYPGLFFLVTVFNASIVLPAPTVLVISIAATALGDPLLVGVVAGFGSAVGEMSGYLIGRGGEKVLKKEHLEGKKYKKVLSFFEKYGFWAIVVLSFLPILLMDFIGLLAGMLRYDWKKFFIATLIGKIPKCLLIAYAGKGVLDIILHALGF